MPWECGEVPQDCLVLGQDVMKKLEIGQKAPDFNLPGVDRRDYSLTSFKDSKILVVVFSCNHCPYARAYEDRLVNIQRDYRQRGVQLVAINANDSCGYPEDSYDCMIERAEKGQFNFPYLRDETQRTARAFGAEYTPEVFLLNAKFQVKYIGRVDDNWQRPDKALSHDLRNAIDATLAHRKIQNPVTPTIGCTIKWKY